SSPSNSLRPPEQSLSRTSERFTALIVAPKRRLGSNRPSGSCFSNARTAEASAMIAPSFTFCHCPTLGDQLGDEVTVFWNAPRHNGLRRLYRLLRGPQPQFAFTPGLDQQFIAWFQTGRRPTFSRYHNATLVVYPGSRAYDTSPPLCHDQM